MIPYILVIVMHVYNGDTVTTQKFLSEQSCKNALSYVKAESEKNDFKSNIKSIGCIKM